MPETGPAPQHAADAHEGGGFLGGFKSLFGGGKHEAAPEPAPISDHVEAAPEVSQTPEQTPTPSTSELTNKPSFTDGVVATEPQPLDLSGAAVSQPTSSEVSHGEQTVNDGAQEGEPSDKEGPESANIAAEPTAEGEFNLDPIAHAEQGHDSAVADVDTDIHHDEPVESAPAISDVTPTDDKAAAFLKNAQAAASSAGAEVSPVEAEATPVATNVTVEDGTVEPIAPHTEESKADEVDTPAADEAVKEEADGLTAPTSDQEPPSVSESETQHTPESVTDTEADKKEEDFPVPVMPIEEKAPTDDAEPSVTVDREATVIPEKLGDETPATEEIQAEKDPAQPSAEALAPVIDLRPALAKLDSMLDDLSALRTSIQEAIDKQKAA